MNLTKIAAIALISAFLTSISMFSQSLQVTQKKHLSFGSIALANSGNDEFMGYASTGEAVIVTSISGYSYGDFNEYRDFTYKIGDEWIEATAICAGGGNKWIAKGYGEYEAQSEATLNMVRFVCDYQGQMD